MKTTQPPPSIDKSVFHEPLDSARELDLECQYKEQFSLDDLKRQARRLKSQIESPSLAFVHLARELTIIKRAIDAVESTAERSVRFLLSNRSDAELKAMSMDPTSEDHVAACEAISRRALSARTKILAGSKSLNALELMKEEIRAMKKSLERKDIDLKAELDAELGAVSAAIKILMKPIVAENRRNGLQKRLKGQEHLRTQAHILRRFEEEEKAALDSGLTDLEAQAAAREALPMYYKPRKIVTDDKPPTQSKTSSEIAKERRDSFLRDWYAKHPRPDVGPDGQLVTAIDSGS